MANRCLIGAASKAIAAFGRMRFDCSIFADSLELSAARNQGRGVYVRVENMLQALRDKLVTCEVRSIAAFESGAPYYGPTIRLTLLESWIWTAFFYLSVRPQMISAQSNC